MNDEPVLCPICKTPMGIEGEEMLSCENPECALVSINPQEWGAINKAIEAAERKGFEMARDKISARAYAWGLDALTAEIRAMKPDGAK